MKRKSGLKGADRAMLYLLAAYTGLRRSKLKSLRVESFDLDSDHPSVTVEATASKHRRRDVQPLRQDLAQQVKAWLGTKKPAQLARPLFSAMGKRTALMLQGDLAVARKTWIAEAVDPLDLQSREQSRFLDSEDDQGRVADFHSLRVTFVTNLCRSGVSSKVAQMLARHSDINLTMNIYTKLGVADESAAVESLPPVPSLTNATETAIGTAPTLRCAQ